MAPRSVTESELKSLGLDKDKKIDVTKDGVGRSARQKYKFSKKRETQKKIEDGNVGNDGNDHTSKYRAEWGNINGVDSVTKVTKVTKNKQQQVKNNDYNVTKVTKPDLYQALSDFRGVARFHDLKKHMACSDADLNSYITYAIQLGYVEEQGQQYVLTESGHEQAQP